MRRQLVRAVRAEFDKQLLKRFPGFRRSKLSEPRYDVYEWKVARQLYLYVALLVYRDQFNVDVGWSTTGRLAEHPSYSPLDKPEKGAILFRLCNFWSEEDIPWMVVPPRTDEEWDQFIFEGKDLKDEPVEETKKRIPLLVDDAIKKLFKYALPYFRRIAAEHGYELSS